MTIKAKLLAGSIALSVFIAAVIALSMITFGGLGDGFVEIINKSDTGVANSRTTEGSIVQANGDLSIVSQGMLAISDDINRTNMTVKILERKIKQLSGTLDEVADEMEYVIEELPDGTTREDLEDVTDSVGDVKEAMRREALISLTTTVKKMDEFSSNIDVQVDSIRKLAEELDKGAKLSAEVLGSNQEINLVSQEFGAKIKSSRNMIVAMLLGIAILCLIATTLFSRSITHPLEHTVEVAQGIAAGDLNQTVDIDRKDEIGQLGSAMSVMIENLRTSIAETERRASESTRIQQALDNVSGNVMVADTEYNLIYLNQAVLQMFRDANAGLGKELPGFSADNLLGANLNVFQYPEFSPNLLAGLSQSSEFEYAVGGHIFNVVANPVISSEGERLGTALEWSDRTQEVEVEREIQGIVDSVVGGDLSGRIAPEDKTGFFREFSEGVNSVVEKLCSTMLEIGQSAGAVRTGSEEIAQGNANLSQRTEEQAASLEETASSMADMTMTVRKNADNATEATDLAANAQKTAENGGEVVSRAVSAMHEINTSSRKISDIIGVIDEIAFQTNLLALNASVEAARAGEQGRGFAVVASEVRNLASRSAEAAKEIKELIEDSVTKVEAGAKLVDESGETLNEIVKGVRQVTDIVGEIAVASRTQSSGIDEVNRAIEQMDELTQQNAALVEEVAAASENMRMNAANLGGVVDGYTLTSAEQGQHSFPADAPADVETYSGGERRAEERPWAGTEAKEESSAPELTAAVSQNEGDWQQF